MLNRQTRERPVLSADEAALRIADLRRVYDEGYLSKGEFESMKRVILARAEPPRTSRAA
jgi:hypothetical protein